MLPPLDNIGPRLLRKVNYMNMVMIMLWLHYAAEEDDDDDNYLTEATRLWQYAKCKSHSADSGEMS